MTDYGFAEMMDRQLEIDIMNHCEWEEELHRNGEITLEKLKKLNVNDFNFDEKTLNDITKVIEVLKDY